MTVSMAFLYTTGWKRSFISCTSKIIFTWEVKQVFIGCLPATETERLGTAMLQYLKEGTKKKMPTAGCGNLSSKRCGLGKSRELCPSDGVLWAVLWEYGGNGSAVMGHSVPVLLE